jgi:hypothetical protein
VPRARFVTFKTYRQNLIIENTRPQFRQEKAKQRVQKKRNPSVLDYCCNVKEDDKNMKKED